jgi:hypothetical protein
VVQVAERLPIKFRAQAQNLSIAKENNQTKEPTKVCMIVKRRRMRVWKDLIKISPTSVKCSLSPPRQLHIYFYFEHIA